MRRLWGVAVRSGALLLGLAAAACVIGDRFYSSYIYVQFPGKTLMETKAAVVDVLSARGDRKGGDWFIDGRQVQPWVDCPGAATRDACLSSLRPRLEWREIEELRNGELRFEVDILKSGQTVADPRVLIQESEAGGLVRFDFVTMGTPLNAWEAEAYYALKRDLVSRFGSAVTTKDEP
ncbi:MAG: hypothetical protein ACM31D_20605 [Bacteroidota bacterium]